ncbi:MAG: sulfotransferase [Solirubrobacterales bacterium]|nr:sulfotransferase [Solirubrobacterales bacterium]
MTADTTRPVTAAAPKTRLPDFFIVGHEKCGTTALHLMVSRHPQIFMSEIKEPRFFAPELRSRFQRLGPGKLPRTLDNYLSLFAAASPEQRVGEASPSYLRSSDAASRIAEVQPAARIIAILREPASFLRSFHLQAVHNHVETQKDFAKAIALEKVRREGRQIPRFSQSPQALLYSDHVRYVEQLRRFDAVFPAEQMLVLIYEDFRGDNEATVRRVLRFLEVDDDLPIEGIETSPLKAVRSLTLLQLGIGLTVARRKAAEAGPVLKTLDALTPRPTSSAAFRKTWRRLVYTDPRPPDEAVGLELRRRFKPEVVALSEYLGRDLVTLWGYDSVG